MTVRPSQRVRAACALHRALLLLARREVRRQHGAEMRTTFAALATASEAHGIMALARLLLHEAVDLIASRRTERDVTPRPRPGGPTAMSMLRALMNGRALGQSLRALARRPAFALTAVLTLALGTAAATTLFSVVDTALVRPLPYPDADRLVTVMEASRSTTSKTSLIAPARLEDWNRMNRTFVAVSGIYSENVTETSGAAPERLDGRRVTPRYFAVYAAPPVVGRTFTDDEEKFGGPGAAVISEGFWTRRFARDPDVTRRALRISGRLYAVVGVMPAAFSSASIDVWLPAQTNPGLAAARNARFLSGVGRLRPGVAPAQAQEDLDRVQRELAVRFPDTDKDWSAAVADLQTWSIGDRARPLWLLFAAVGVLWLIALANVAALVLVEMRRRDRELAVRAALGASRGRLIGDVVREVLVLCVAAVSLGAGAATWMIAGIRRTFDQLPRVGELALNGRALAFTAVTGIVAALLCGLLPAVAATRRPAAEVARGGRGTAAGAHRIQRMLVVAQVALSLLLCVSAALLVRSYDNLTRVDGGFTTDGVYTFHIGARWDEDRTAVARLQTRIVEEVARQPGVRAIGLTNFLPLPGATLRFQYKLEGNAGTDPGGLLTVGSRSIGANYLAAIGARLAAGASCRAFRIDPHASGEVLVNQRFVDRFSPGENLVGRHLFFAQDLKTPKTIVGVVANVAEDGAGADIVPFVYECLQPGNWPDPEYVVRLGNPETFARTLRPLVGTIDPSRAVFGYQPLAHWLYVSQEDPRVHAELTTLFASTALVLAAIGLYGLFMLIVSESRREIGVRLALGAAPTRMIGFVAASAGRLLAAGLVVGLGLTAAAGQVLRSMLFGVSVFDAATVGIVTTLLAIAASAATAIPAIRASRVSPTEALRE